MNCEKYSGLIDLNVLIKPSQTFSLMCSPKAAKLHASTKILFTDILS